MDLGSEAVEEPRGAPGAGGLRAATARPRRAAAPAAAGLLLALAASCREPDRPSDARIVHLAALYEPPAGLLETPGGGRGYDLDFRIAPDAWAAQGTPGLWRARAPWYDGALPVVLDAPAELVLEDGERVERAEPDVDAPQRWLQELVAAEAFALVREDDGDYVFLGRNGEARPPAATLRARVSAGAARDGRWRIAGGPFAGDGFLVRPEEPVTVPVDVAPGSRLLLDLVCIAEGGRPDADVVLRVRLGGEPIGERVVRAADRPVPWPVDLALPPEGRAGARLAFELEGEAWCALLAPRIAPSSPAPSARPDVVVFLADTLRADALGSYGGPDGLTPALDAFAAEGLRFARAWAPSCWTLPSHASMFLGVYPPQHGAVATDLKPGAELVTLAERLRSAGYRTAAVTDGLFVSRRFDLDRGFEHFEEHHQEPGEDAKHLGRTLERARALAAADDGRPLFLFVHTYRVHEPYVVSAETRAELGGRLGIAATWDELEARVQERLLREVEDGNERALKMAVEGDFHRLLEELRFTGPDADGGDEGEGFVAAVRALYLGGVRDLDRGFAAFLADLAARPRAPHTWVIFASDHGEAFQEHATMFHGAGVWEENLRVPLIVRGPGLAPGVVDHGASLVDLPRTVAEIAGVAPAQRWGGRSLLSLTQDRPIFSFDCAQRGEPAAMAVDGPLKVVFPPDPAGIGAARPERAFDLARDPGETQDLAASARARTALERLAERALELLEPLSEPGRAELDAGARRAMAALGYVDGRSPAEEKDR